MAIIRLDDLSLTYRVREHRRVALKDYLLRRMFLRAANPLRDVNALQNVSLEINDGDRLGIVGHNGAGKSTLLKVLAGIYPPTSGTRYVEGHISSMFDLTLGFEPDASGWENIAYRGYLQGETPKTIRAKSQAIAEFSELGDFLQTPVRYYSSGMVVRLAFAIATAIDPEILLVDEVLSAGDMSFLQKARARMGDMMSRAKLIVMVSHDLGALEKLCNRAVWLDKGRIRAAGSMSEIIPAYTKAMQQSPAAPPAVKEAKIPFRRAS